MENQTRQELLNNLDKKVTMNLVGSDGNAFAIMGNFSRNAKRQGWTQSEIDLVLEEAKSDDYNHLLCTIMDFTQTEED